MHAMVDGCTEPEPHNGNPMYPVSEGSHRVREGQGYSVLFAMC